MTPGGVLTVHASTVALNGRAALIRGASGSGKSALALALMARGAHLVADDRTCIARRPRGLLAWSPDPILGLIEARGLGLLRADPAPPTLVFMVVDLDLEEPERFPRARECDLAGGAFPLVAGGGNPYLADALVQFLKTGSRIHE